MKATWTRKVTRELASLAKLGHPQQVNRIALGRPVVI